MDATAHSGRLIDNSIKMNSLNDKSFLLLPPRA
jgi:hypothetical protein